VHVRHVEDEVQVKGSVQRELHRPSTHNVEEPQASTGTLYTAAIRSWTTGTLFTAAACGPTFAGSCALPGLTKQS